jgi:membrane associated rhomboid family serine protease
MKPLRFGAVVVPPITFGIVVVLVAMFIVAGIAMNFAQGLSAGLAYLPLSVSHVLEGQVWRLATYALLHSLADPFHLLLNGFMIFMFGRELESRWGAGRYILFTALTVVVGGVFVVLSSVLFSRGGTAVGASAFSEGLIVAWGLTFRDRPLRLFFAVEVKGIHLVWFAIFLWVLQAVSASPVSASAHLGGMVTAAVLVLGVWRPNAVKVAWWSALERLGLKKKPKLYVVPGPKGNNGKPWVN